MAEVLYTCNALSRGHIASSQLKLSLPSSLMPQPTNFSRSQARRQTPLFLPLFICSHSSHRSAIPVWMSLYHSDSCTGSPNMRPCGLLHSTGSPSLHVFDSETVQITLEKDSDRSAAS